MKKLSILIFLFFASSYIFSQENSKPNVVLIMVDDLAYECININGGDYKTPNLDKLALNGIRFENCHSQPICTPSRVRIMTGKTNKKNYLNFGVLDKKETVFSQLLKENGYKTLIAGKWQLQLDKSPDIPKHFGFDEYILWQVKTRGRDSTGRDKRYVNPELEINGRKYEKNEGAYSTDLIVDYINDFMIRNKEQPFLVYYPMILTHCPFDITPHSNDWDPTDMGSETYKGDAKYFSDMVSYMDYSIGRIVKQIDDLKLREETLIIFTSDNGNDSPIISNTINGEMPWGKGKTTDNGTHAPLIVSLKGKVKEGSVSKRLVDFSDFLPTICEFTGTEIPENSNIDGISFLPQILGSKKSKKKFIYTWYFPRPYKEGKDNKPIEWTRNENFKLYGNGNFFNVKKDFYEQKPLSIDKLNSIQKENYNELKKGLKSYKKIKWEKSI